VWLCDVIKCLCNTFKIYRVLFIYLENIDNLKLSFMLIGFSLPIKSHKNPISCEQFFAFRDAKFLLHF
jgi:hypothetical protein